MGDIRMDDAGGTPELTVFLLPDVGEGLTEAEIVSWFVGEGEAVTVNQPIVAIETAKAVVELPCPVAGIVAALHVMPGSVVPVGTPIISFREQGSYAQADHAIGPVPNGPVPNGPVPNGDGAARDVEHGQMGASGAVLVGYGVRPGHGGPSPSDSSPLRRRRHRTPVVDSPSGRVRAKPLVRRMARTLGVDLDQVQPSGAYGEVTREDLSAFVNGRSAASSTDAPAHVRTLTDSRVEPLRGVQRAMADAMTRSALSIPHAMVWRDVDVTRTVELVQAMRQSARYTGLKVTPLTIAAAAVVSMLRSYPLMQARWSDDGLIHPRAINLGIAVDSPRGLIVPNIKDAGSMSLVELATALGALVETARAGRSTPSDMTGGTITITNIGVFDVDGGTPIINPGESAIVALGRVSKRPWVIGEHVVPRSALTISMSFDHRVIDGATASHALSAVTVFLEDPAVRLVAE